MQSPRNHVGDFCNLAEARTRQHTICMLVASVKNDVPIACSNRLEGRSTTKPLFGESSGAGTVGDIECPSQSMDVDAVK
jgi:hypothetical protein